MPSPSERQRNNIRAGVWVTVALVLGLAVFIVLTDAIDALSRSTREYTVTFDVSSGVSNLKPGGDVRVGGVRMGEVISVDPQVEVGDAFRTIAVRFNVDHRVEIYRNAIIFVTAPLIGSDAWLEIPSVGDPSAGAPPNGVIAGAASAGFLTSLLGSENADKAAEMVENARLFSEFLAGVDAEYETRMVPILDNLNSATGDARAVVSDIRTTQWPSWAESVSRVMDWAAAVPDKFDAALTEGHGLLADSRATVNENREGVRAIVGNVESATQRINSETIDKVHALLDTGQEGLDAASAVLQDMRVDYSGWATNIGEALANANLAAQQLKLTTIETRRSPWKLLYRPSADELEHELLYEATRSFAVAAADLKAASESVRRVLADHGDAVALNQEAYQRLEQNLLNSLANYEKAQQQLLDVLLADSEQK